MSYLTRTLWLSTLFIFTFCGGNHVQKYAWQDSKGFQYLTVEYKGHFSAESISPNKPGFAFLPVEASPFLAREGYAQKTFQVVRFLGEARPQALIKPIVYLIGETHIGKSQIRVAKELKRLIETHRIDAILLEQPEDKKFNWELFKPLTQNPRRALVALQRRMLRDSKGSFNYNYGRYDKYFTNVKDNASFKKAIMSVAKIYGIPTAKRLIDSLTRQSRHIKNDYKRYKDGKYIS
ncbi:MAG: hypothetical protein OEY67_10205, partial [Gammaproteobacteria bacterium]|nr:hypothetical protein [Gammaproteobacteria bacterium]